ncbi:MAG: T9SS type A sorting domain-containing protein [Calditrichaceae bacterium]|nr:T9SS type A sorting domain-containing protein [Calditrichaceae bacterium]
MLKNLPFFIIVLLLFSSYTFAQAPGGVTGSIEVWLKADAGINGVGADTDGDPVNTWTDQGSMTNNASAANLAPPTYYDSTLNNYPVVVFDGVNDGMDFGGDYVYATGTGMDWFAVLQPNTEVDKTRQMIVDFGLYSTAGYGFMYGSEAYGFHTPEDAGGEVTQDQIHSRSTLPTLVSFRIDFNDNQSMAFNGASAVSTQAISSLTNITATNINDSPTHDEFGGPVTIGHQSKTQNLSANGGRMYSGALAEVVGYSTVLTDANRNRVETYLALKYGLTISHNYIAYIGISNTTIYDVSTYPYDIAGVGQDNTSQGLNQFQSKSLNSGSLIEGTITDANIDEDEYVVWGHNNASVSLGSAYDGTGETRITRIWKVTTTGTPGSMTISIPTSVAGGLTEMIVDDDTDISDPGDIVGSYTLSVNGDNYEATVTFPTNATSYFTFITDQPGGYKFPGGVSANLELWLKADSGALSGGSPAGNGDPVNSWEDWASSNDATDTNLDAPDFRDNPSDRINNNPVVEFNGSSDGLDLGGNFITSSSGGMTWFAVVEPNDESSKPYQRVVDFGQYPDSGYGFSYGSEVFHFYTSTDDGGNSITPQSHSRDTSATLVTYEIDFSGGADQQMSLDGVVALNDATISLTQLNTNIRSGSTHTTNSGPVTIGQQSQSGGISSDNGRYFSGRMAEIVGYNNILSAADRYKVETYLALKYGLTLGHNYIANVNGNTTIYNISGYANNIAGVGKDLSNQDMLQLSSKSEGSGALVTGSISDANLDDDEYIIWGNDGGSDTLTTSFAGEPVVRLGRIWKVTATGTPGNMTISIPIAVSPALTFLVVSNSPTITSTSDLSGSHVLSVNGSNYEATVTFSGTQYFTFISSAPGGTTFPGVVSDNLAFWLKANDGVLNSSADASDGDEVYTWEDVSGNIIKKDATDTNLNQRPNFRNNTTDNINNNPVVEFDGSSDGLDLESNYIYSASSQTGMQWFAVVQPDASGQLRRIVDFGDYSDGGYGFSYSTDYYEFYTATNATYGGGVNNTGNTHSNGTNPVLINFTVDFNATQSFALNGSTPLASDVITLSELTVSNIGESATHDTNLGPVTIGRQSEDITGGAPYFSGKMAEVICYKADLPDSDEDKVETYLALKYGLTIGHNYIADISGSNTTIYDISTYANDVAGIGQDVLGQALDQRTSKSSNSGSLIIMSVADGNIDDEEYLVWGNNNAFDSLNTTFEGVDSTRFGTVWKVTETGIVGDVTVSIPLSAVGGALTYLLVADSPAMSAISELTAWRPLTVNGSNYEATVNFTSSSTQYFTFTSSTDASLPVNLSTFSAASINEAVELSWTTESQFENSGFEIWKSEKDANEFKLLASYKDHAELSGDGNSSETREYTFIDHEVEVGKTYLYKLSDVDFNGGRTFHGVIDIKVEAIMPTKLALHSNYPNPFNPTTTIRFDVPEFYADKRVTLQVFNIVGQRVATLLNGNVDSGRHEITWDSRNTQGNRLPSGLYFVVMQAENFRKVHKMMLVK